MSGQDLPRTLTLEGAQALRLLAHDARQRVIAEIYDDGRELTATEAASLCGLTPSAMSYHLRMLEKAGVLVPVEAVDGRERRYRRAALSFAVRSTGGGSTSRVHLRATVGIWLDSLTASVQRWLDTGSDRSGGMTTESLRLTEEESAELLDRIRSLFAEYSDISEQHGPDVPRWEHYWAHLPKNGDDGDRSSPA